MPSFSQFLMRQGGKIFSFFLFLFLTFLIFPTLSVNARLSPDQTSIKITLQPSIYDSGGVFYYNHGEISFFGISPEGGDFITGLQTVSNYQSVTQAGPRYITTGGVTTYSGSTIAISGSTPALGARWGQTSCDFQQFPPFYFLNALGGWYFGTEYPIDNTCFFGTAPSILKIYSGPAIYGVNQGTPYVKNNVPNAGSTFGASQSKNMQSQFRIVYDRSSTLTSLFEDGGNNFNMTGMGNTPFSFFTYTSRFYHTISMTGFGDVVNSYQMSSFLRSLWDAWGNGIAFTEGFSSNPNFFTRASSDRVSLSVPGNIIRTYNGFMAVPLRGRHLRQQDSITPQTIVFGKVALSNGQTGVVYTVYNATTSDPLVLNNSQYGERGFVGTQGGIYTGVLNNCPNVGSTSHTGFAFCRVFNYFDMLDLVDTNLWNKQHIVNTISAWDNTHLYFSGGTESRQLSLTPDIKVAPVLGGYSSTGEYTSWSYTGGGSTPTVAGMLGALAFPFCNASGCVTVISSGIVGFPSGAYAGLYTGSVNTVTGFLQDGFQNCVDPTYYASNISLCQAYRYFTTGASQGGFFGVTLFGCPSTFASAGSGLTFKLGDVPLLGSINIFGVDLDILNGSAMGNFDLFSPFQCVYGAIKVGFNDVSYRSQYTGGQIFSGRTFTGEYISLGDQTSHVNILEIILNLLLVAPAVYIAYKILK